MTAHHEDHKDHKGSRGLLDDRVEFMGRELVDASIKVHRALGPGLLESAYEACLIHELTQRGIPVRSQVPIPIFYEGVKVEAGYRADLVLGDDIIVELKSVEKLLKIHEAQLLTYLKLANVRLGFLINFNSVPLKEGIKRMVL